jgi:adhesin/invasin
MPFRVLLLFFTVTAAACLGGTTEAASTGPYYTLSVYGGTLESSTVPASSSTTVHVQVMHAGAAAPGVPITWMPKGGNSRVASASVVSDTLGVVSAIWFVSDTVGTDTLTAVTIDGSAQLKLFAQVVAGAASLMTRVTPSPDSVAAGTPLVLAAKVTDRTGNAVANVTIQWSASSGTLSAQSAATNASGVASATFTPPSKGTFTVTADLPNRATVIFTIVAT